MVALFLPLEGGASSWAAVEGATFQCWCLAARHCG